MQIGKYTYLQQLAQNKDCRLSRSRGVTCGHCGSELPDDAVVVQCRQKNVSPEHSALFHTDVLRA